MDKLGESVDPPSLPTPYLPFSTTPYHFRHLQLAFHITLYPHTPFLYFIMMIG